MLAAPHTSPLLYNINIIRSLFSEKIPQSPLSPQTTITTFIITSLFHQAPLSLALPLPLFSHHHNHNHNHLLLLLILLCEIPITMSSMMSAQGVVFATAMAVSGTVILLALRLQKSLPTTQFSVHEIPSSRAPILRSCISSAGKKREKKKKRVHFAEDVMDSCRDGEEFRRQHVLRSNSGGSKVQNQKGCGNGGTTEIRGMPANRVALYNGILRDRVAQRLAYSC